MTQVLEEKVLDILQGGLTPEEMDVMLPRLLSDPAQVEKDLREQIAAESNNKQTYSDVELRLMEDFTPAFIVESDVTIELGHGAHTRIVRLRELNMDDFERLSAYAPDVLRYVFKEGPALFKNWNASEMLNTAIRFGLRDRRDGKPTEYSIWLYEELARLLNNPLSAEQPITAAFLRACRPGQIIRAVKQLYAVNVDFFGELWAEMPTDMTTQISSWTGTITSGIGNLMQRGAIMLERIKNNMTTVQTTTEDLNSVGTTPSGGTTNSSGH